MIGLFWLMEGKKIIGLGKGARGCLRGLYRASSVKCLLLVLQATPSDCRGGDILILSLFTNNIISRYLVIT